MRQAGEKRKGKEYSTHPTDKKHYLVQWALAAVGLLCPQMVLSVFQRFGLWGTTPREDTVTFITSDEPRKYGYERKLAQD